MVQNWNDKRNNKFKLIRSPDNKLDLGEHSIILMNYFIFLTSYSDEKYNTLHTRFGYSKIGGQTMDYWILGNTCFASTS